MKGCYTVEKRMIESRPYEGLRNGTHIDVEVYYSKGGANYLSGGYTSRGYYVSVTPVTRKGDGMVSYILFNGVKKLLMQTARFSAKQFEQAVEMGKDTAPELIASVLKQEQAA